MVPEGHDPLELAQAHREVTGHWLWNGTILPGEVRIQNEIQERYGPKIVSEGLRGCERIS